MGGAHHPGRAGADEPTADGARGRSPERRTPSGAELDGAVLDGAVRRALEEDLVIDLTTIGRTSGRPRRIEIWLLHQDGRFFITGTPGRRDWLDNVRRDAAVVLHVTQSMRADVAARAVEVTDPATRRSVLSHPSAAWYRGRAELDELVEVAPMIEIFI